MVVRFCPERMASKKHFLKRSCPMSVTKKSSLRVGEDITVDPRIEASGKIRLRSAEAAEVARMFGLGRAVRNRKRRGTPTAAAEVRVALAPGTITLISGASGAGKST